MWKFLIYIELFIIFECPFCQDNETATPEYYDEDYSDVYGEDDISTPQSSSESGETVDDVYEDDYDDEIPELEETEDCVCVRYFQCDKDGHIITDGRLLMDPRDAYIIPQHRKKRSPLNCTAIGPEFVECCRNIKESPFEHECGTRNFPSIMGRVVAKYTSDVTEFAEWPWQAAILENNVFMCGATLIDNRHVLTVAHCVERLLNYNHSAIVRLGEWDLKMSSEVRNHRDHSVSEIFLHPQYRPKILYNDIAILKLATSVYFLSHINTVCLPRPYDYFIGQNCIVTGWGTNKYGKETYSRILKAIRLPIISNEQCEQLLRKTKLSHQFRLHDSFICAGGKKGKDACTGDGGGPLVCLNYDNTYTLVGLVSWGIGCGSPRVPGVYVNVQMFLEWIEQITGNPLEAYWSY